MKFKIDPIDLAWTSGHGRLAKYIELAADGHSPARRPANRLRFVFKAIGKTPELSKIMTTLPDRRMNPAERVPAWFEWMGFSGRRSPEANEAIGWYHGHTDYGRTRWIMKIIVEATAQCAAAIHDEGWEDITCLFPWIAGMQRTRRKGDPQFEEALASDSVAQTELLNTVGIGRLTRPVLRDLIDADNEGRIIEHVLKNNPKVYKVMSPREILLHTCVACPSDEKAMKIIHAVLEKEPDICRISDRNGFTPLVYTLFAHRVPEFWYRRRDKYFPRRRQLEAFLVEHGTSPTAQDRFGLSWSDLVGTVDLKDYLTM